MKKEPILVEKLLSGKNGTWLIWYATPESAPVVSNVIEPLESNDRRLLKSLLAKLQVFANEPPASSFRKRFSKSLGDGSHGELYEYACGFGKRGCQIRLFGWHLAHYGWVLVDGVLKKESNDKKLKNTYARAAKKVQNLQTKLSDNHKIVFINEQKQ